jgi:hypothetical protein
MNASTLAQAKPDVMRSLWQLKAFTSLNCDLNQLENSNIKLDSTKEQIMGTHMSDQFTIRLLKIAMFCGISLIVFGHYLWVVAQIHLSMGVQGIMIIAACCAFGVILSLPTKIYLTILLMAHEERHQH